MQHSEKPLNDFAADLFAGIPVKDFQASLKWYEQLFGCPPTFFPNDVEAVWQVADHQWVYIIVDPKRAGGAINTILGADLDKLVSQISGRGLEFGEEEAPAENTRKVMYFDPDGNEMGFGSVATS